MLSSPGEWLPPYLAPFFSLSDRVEPPVAPDSFPDSTYYSAGPQDICFIITCIAVMAVLRDILRLNVFEPFADWKLTNNLHEKRSAGKDMNGDAKSTNGHHANGNGNGVSKKELRHIHRSVLRFAEQGWSAVYYPIQFCFGLYVNYNLPTELFNNSLLWANYPHVYLAAPVKLYYLTQTAFYSHQILILNAEAPRKDHYQMMAHHIISVILMGTSYYCNFTRVGCFIMVLMDCCDIFLPIAKMMRYIEASRSVCDSLFAFFVVSWFITRHVIFIPILISVWREVPKLVEREYFWLFFGSLTALQIIQLIWFGTICRVVWKVVTTSEGASDVRSDEEG
ncbi:longevity-assurance protein [Mycena pura]|uniref:Longevity-assurance protein n=1 Tax=Mycena pura TaxID=153505 RepID=A0AAD6YTH6_9AGAR|nr:longevity-assurance protein [Mycena pura]